MYFIHRSVASDTTSSNRLHDQLRKQTAQTAQLSDELAQSKTTLREVRAQLATSQESHKSDVQDMEEKLARQKHAHKDKLQRSRGKEANSTMTFMTEIGLLGLYEQLQRTDPSKWETIGFISQEEARRQVADDGGSGEEDESPNVS